MSIEENMRKDEFELSLSLLREWEGLVRVRYELSSKKETWRNVIDGTLPVHAMEWGDYRVFRARVVAGVKGVLAAEARYGVRLHRIICHEFEYCRRLTMPMDLMLKALSVALAGYFSQQIADLLLALLVSHDLIKTLCGC